MKSASPPLLRPKEHIYNVAAAPGWLVREGLTFVKRRKRVHWELHERFLEQHVNHLARCDFASEDVAALAFVNVHEDFVQRRYLHAK